VRYKLTITNTIGLLLIYRIITIKQSSLIRSSRDRIKDHQLLLVLPKKYFILHLVWNLQHFYWTELVGLSCSHGLGTNIFHLRLLLLNCYCCIMLCHYSLILALFHRPHTQSPFPSYMDKFLFSSYMVKFHFYILHGKVPFLYLIWISSFFHLTW